VADGVLVAVEGIDRSGKTTLVAALAAALRAASVAVATRTEPSRGPIGVLFRRLADCTELPAAAAALLSAADRHEQQPAVAAQLAGHDVVLSDRYYLSGLAYHHADGIDPGFYRSLNEGVRRPDLYLHLAITPAVAATRGQPPQGRWEHPAFTDRLPDAYQHCIRLLADIETARLVHIDATRPPAHVLADALAAVQTLNAERNLTP
jgi:dTMP kinase